MNLEQRRMTGAYSAIEGVKKEQRENWKRAVLGLGAEIQRVGLLQALAFLHRGPTKEIAGDLCKAIRGHLVALGHLPKKPSGNDLLTEVRDLARMDYMRVTRETMALSVWLKRAAEIVLKDK
jgi:CRISPR-associated protein Cmr5